jgi:hypothetical protein
VWQAAHNYQRVSQIHSSIIIFSEVCISPGRFLAASMAAFPELIVRFEVIPRCQLSLYPLSSLHCSQGPTPGYLADALQAFLEESPGNVFRKIEC